MKAGKKYLWEGFTVLNPSTAFYSCGVVGYF